MRELAAQFLALAEKQSASGPRMVGHRLMGISLLFTGDPVAARRIMIKHWRSMILSNISALTSRFGHDVRRGDLQLSTVFAVALGYPEAALRRRRRALSIARDLGQAATLMYALTHVGVPIYFAGAMKRQLLNSRSTRFIRRKERPALASLRHVEPRLAVGFDR